MKKILEFIKKNKGFSGFIIFFLFVFFLTFSLVLLDETNQYKNYDEKTIELNDKINDICKKYLDNYDFTENTDISKIDFNAAILNEAGNYAIQYPKKKVFSAFYRYLTGSQPKENDNHVLKKSIFYDYVNQSRNYQQELKKIDEFYSIIKNINFDKDYKSQKIDSLIAYKSYSNNKSFNNLVDYYQQLAKEYKQFSLFEDKFDSFFNNENSSLINLEKQIDEKGFGSFLNSMENENDAQNIFNLSKSYINEVLEMEALLKDYDWYYLKEEINEISTVYNPIFEICHTCNNYLLSTENNSNWLISAYVDDFRQYTNDLYIANKEQFKGNKIKERENDSDAGLVFLIDNNYNSFSVELILYENDKKIFANDNYIIRIKDNNNQEYSFYGKQYKDRISINNSDSEKIIDLLSNEEQINILIKPLYSSSQSSYLFKIKDKQDFNVALNYYKTMNKLLAE